MQAKVTMKNTYLWISAFVMVIMMMVPASMVYASEPTNGDFEDDLTGWTDSYGSVSISSDAHGGAKACLCQGGASGAGINSPSIAVTAGDIYRLNSYVKQTAGTGAYKVTIAWLDSGGGVIEYSNDWKGTNQPSFYTWHGGSFIAPAGAVTCVILLGVVANTDCLFDDIVLEQYNFSPDYVYSIKYNPSAHTVTIRVFNEADGAWVKELMTSPYDVYWESLTFAGVGDSDAQLFVARGTGTDIEVAEIDKNGSTVKSNTLSAIMGLTPPLSTNLNVGNIRFSRGRPDSLFVSAASDITGTSRGMAWEIDLGLSTLKNTYSGPVAPLPGLIDTEYRAAYIDVAPDGTLYMVGMYLGQPTSDDGLGDLVSFDTSGGSTSSFTTLIDGPTYNPGDNRWNKPSGVAFRSANPDDGTPTIEIGQVNLNPTPELPVLEFYLDTTAHPLDANNNLIYRGTQISIKRPFKGQQDEVTGSIWWGSAKQGLHEIKATDATRSIDSGASPMRAYWDADSPFTTEPPPPVPPIIMNVSPDPNPALAGIEGGVEYVKKLILLQGTPPVTWSLLQGPTGAVIDQTGQVSGWTPVWEDIYQMFTFGAQAVNSYGSDTVTWTVKVHPLNKGFVGDYVYVITDTSGELRMLDEATGTDMGALSAVETGLDSLAFLGAGKNDARLFVAKSVFDGDITTDVKIMEIDSTGNTLQSNTLSAIMGLPPPLSTNFAFGSIRFSRGRPDSLFVSAASDISGTSKGMAWEIDLDLSTLKNTYTGPVNPLKVLDNNYRAACIDTAPNGTLYMSGFHLGQNVDVPNSEVGLGDLVAFDTSGGSTTSFTTLVDGPTFNVSNPAWASPQSPIFRNGFPGRDDGTDTVVVLMNPRAGNSPAQEVYLDTTLHPVDADGNLALRGSPISVPRGWRGHQDLISGDIWLGALRGGVHAIRFDETTSSYKIAVYWVDAARAPFNVCNDPAPDIDGDGDVDQDDFAVFQVCYSPDAPAGGLTASCSCLDLGDDDSNGIPDRDGDIDGLDFTAFQGCASGPGIAANPACDG